MKYAKALVSAAIAGLTAVGTGLTDGVMTGPEWIAAAVAFLLGLGAVATVPNKQDGA